GSDGYMTKPFTIDRLATVLGDYRSEEVASVAEPQGSTPPAAPLFDPDTLAQLELMQAKTGSDLKTRIWSLFCDKATAAFADLEATIDAGVQGDDVTKAAHAIKSMALSAGAARFANGCSAVETLSATGAGPEPVREAMREASLALLETVRAMGVDAGQDAAA
ncbi:MAG: Hpt domain-containing protein, partial [Pseudomonadota bacterium]